MHVYRVAGSHCTLHTLHVYRVCIFGRNTLFNALAEHLDTYPRIIIGKNCMMSFYFTSCMPAMLQRHHATEV